MTLLTKPVTGPDLGALLSDIIDPKVGIISYLAEVRREPGAPRFFHFASRACDTSWFCRQENFRDGGGAATDRRRAAAKAVGEAIERYSSAIYDIEELPLCAEADAPFDCVAPSEFALYSQAQYDDPGFPWVPFDVDTSVRWTSCIDAVTGRPVHVPAARIYMPYTYYIGTGDAPIDQPISTGLACHMSYELAAVTAICEVVERDAVMLTWQAMLAPPQIRIETLSDENYDLVQRFESTGASVAMLDITLDHGIPTILSVLRGGAPGAAALVVAASSSLDPEVAAAKSLEELAHTRRFSQYARTWIAPLEPDPPDYECVADQVTHLAFWADPANTGLADFLFSSSRRVEFDELTSHATGNTEMDLERLISMVSSVGERVLIKDLTSSDVADLGLAVVRAVIPGFHPLHMGFKTRALGGQRLWRVPQRLGYPGISLESGDNPAPHPYP
jgi:ribosomal protein S12 methylthiotransferase accessory factor